ncbi:MAG: ATP-binding protein [Oligoflexia bacterium]|nr:ATP-binding protein [Oligoflexia bacterium]
MKFVGRLNELELLSDQIRNKSSSLITILGRRRIGKSTLVKHFSEINKLALFEFQGLAPRPRLSNKDQLNNFSQTLFKFLKIKPIEFSDWSQAFSYLNHLVLSSKKKMVIFLDEISWMGCKDADFAGKLKQAWDTELSQNTNIILILCGSVSSWIQKNILTSTGFAGRVSLEINLKELSLAESAELLRLRGHKLNHIDLAKILSVTGGVPKYLEEMKHFQTAEANIVNHCFRPSGFLFFEFDRIFSEIFGSVNQIYKDILVSLKDAPLSPSDLAKKLKRTLNGDISYYLSSLELGGFIRREYTWNLSGNESRLSMVRISDNYTRFYLKYIESRKKRLEKKPLKLNDSLDFLNWPTLVGIQIETLILNNISILVDILKIPSSEIVQLGPYFQTGTKLRPGVQIDCLIQCKRGILHAVEIKSSPKIGSDILTEVKEKNKRLKLPRGFSVRNHLVYLDDLSDSVVEADFFDYHISFSQFISRI